MRKMPLAQKNFVTATALFSVRTLSVILPHPPSLSGNFLCVASDRFHIHSPLFYITLCVFYRLVSHPQASDRLRIFIEMDLIPQGQTLLWWLVWQNHVVLWQIG